MEKVIEHARERFWKQGFDILLDFPSESGKEARGSKRLRKEVEKIMSEGEGGVVLTVLDGGNEQGVAHDISGSEKAVRSNVVSLKSKGDDGKYNTISSLEGAAKDVQECVKRFRNVQEHKSDAASRNRRIADLLLYLSTDLASEISGAKITADGRWKNL